MASFETHDLLGNATSIDHLHESLEKIEDKEETEVISSSGGKESASNGESPRTRKSSISSVLSSIKFGSMLGGFKADAKSKEANIESANKAREARKLAIAEKARQEKEKKEKEMSTSPVSRSLFGKDSRYRRASESRRHSMKKSQEVDPAVMKEAQAIIRRVESDVEEATISDVEKICNFLKSVLEEQPKLARRLVGDDYSPTATSSSVQSAAVESEQEEMEENEVTSSGHIATGAGRSRRSSEVSMRKVTSDQKEKGYKDDIIGCRLAVKGGDDEWYDGVVVSYHVDPTDDAVGYHHIVFGDGVEATLDLSKEDMFISEE